jgi:hypothetical protein
LYFFVYLRNFIAALHLQMRKAQISFPASFFDSPTMHAHIAVLPCHCRLHQVPPPLRLVSKLLFENKNKIIRRWSHLAFVLVQIIRTWLLAGRTSAFLLPPLLAIPPPHCAKDSAMENIHRQLLGTSRSHLTPTPVHDSGLVPRFIAIACLVDPVHQGSYAD